MKYLNILLVLFISFSISAQTFEIRTHYDNNSTFSVEMRCTSEPHPTTASTMLDMVFGIKWLAIYDVDLSNATGNYNISKSDVEKVKGSYEFQAFYANNCPYTFPDEWTIDTWITIASFDVSQSSSTEIGTFEITEVGFDPTTDLNINIDAVDYTPTINGFADNVVIPITLANLKAEKFNNTSSIVSWDSYNEVNFDRFNIERSYDNSNWMEIVSLISEGKRSNSYSYIDKDVYNGEGTQIINYRLKMIDLDGKFEYSDIKSVTFNNTKGKLSLDIFPNPASEKVFYTFSKVKPNEDLNFKLYNSIGKLVLNKTINSSDNLLFDNSFYNFKAGIYNVIIKDTKGERFYKRVVLSK